jgi:hypothetical protein
LCMQRTGVLVSNCKLFFIFVLALCNGYTRIAEAAVYDKYVNEVVKAFEKDVKKKYGIICIGSGGTMRGSVERISLRFHSYQRTTLEEARELIVALKEDLIRRVNAHEKIRPFLKEYPFSWFGADIAISFYKPRGSSHYLDESVALVCSANRGKEIAYARAELQTRQSPAIRDEKGNILMPATVDEDEFLVDILQETCEEAARIVHAKDQNK